ncbi:MAG: thioredoxin [Candidatus Pacebacteria bacterium]|nr:thioredoxin [Candidatus Paceibacterota bacterium]
MLLEFYGETCSHCLIMKPRVEKMEKEKGVKVEKYEVWNNKDNVKKMAEYDKDLCGGVPFFFNTETKKFICGSVPEDELLDWAGFKK